MSRRAARAGFERLAELYRQRFAETARATAEAAEGISDLQFTAAYRVPFQFSRIVREHLELGQLRAVLRRRDASPISTATALYDLTGSYGVNLFGYDFYKDCIARAEQRARRDSARCSAPITRSSPTTCGGCARSPASTKSRSTCPAPRP